MKAVALFLGLTAGSCAQTVVSSGPPATPALMPVVSIPQVSFQFERVGLPVPKFTIVVHEDGTGTYQAQVASVSGGGRAAVQPTASSPPVNRPIKISPPMTETIFKTAHALDHFNMECASKAKNIADTGKKTLSYKGVDGQGSCLYNYSENKSVTQLTETFQAIAFTMDEGRKLEFMHRFDRLGLYSEIDVLSHEVQEKRALEVGNIAPALRAIIADEDLMQKVRERAAKLLAQAEEPK
ncbi:hypothetical protein [Edaphobacter modestus]|uniref:Uncharacterized protein n=1 Tax=Edaphobacter modestus TaxID=388466 RepID=A0A4Q7YQA0_9BACT|nr:hypothetical protein [Edaphobacter modestus]RZU39857.1 hypothetical protein BDD14_1252 [Edaphobacter modestus]